MYKSLVKISGSENFLLEELKRGNSKAFDIIFERYYENLCRFAFSLVHDADMSQSLVQNVFVKIWERRFVLGTVKNIAAYLATMVKNQCADYLKEQRICTLALKDKKDKESDDSTEKEIYCRDFEEHLLIALSKLPPRCRLAFEYSRFEDLTNKEIAAKLKISIKGVEALIGRSLKFLRVELKEFLPSFNLKKINPILFFLNFSKKVLLIEREDEFFVSRLL